MMKKRFRLYLIIAFLLTLVLSSGVYAHAFRTSTGTINITDPTGDIATSNTTATQPDWEDILIPVADTENFRPSATGDNTTVEEQYPATGEHWDKVSENISDGDGTYVASSNSNWREDLYNTANHSTQTVGGTITYVRIYMVCKATTDNITQTSAYIHIKTNGVGYNGTAETLTANYTAYWYEWDNNPNTGQAWTWNEIDALQIGIGLRQPNVDEYTRCTQVYAEVGFEAPPLTGNTPIGDLFIVTPNDDYTGDLSVKVYLVNTDNLTMAYQSLNMELYLEGSVEAGQTPNYRVLNIQNGLAAFKIEGCSGGSHVLSVTGGDYTLTSREISEWEQGWAVAPDLYCEVTQR